MVHNPSIMPLLLGFGGDGHLKTSHNLFFPTAQLVGAQPLPCFSFARHLWVKIVATFGPVSGRSGLMMMNPTGSNPSKTTNKTNVSQVSGRRPFKDTSLKHSRAFCHFVDVRVPRVEMHELKITRFCSSNSTLNLGKAGCV